MHVPMFQIDAFADRIFSGNPAAVCPLDQWLPDAVMQAVAAENNLAETAFFAPEGEGYRLRWFTPDTEVDLCGHATLASGWLVLNRLRPDLNEVTFLTASGALVVGRGEAGRLTMDFPSRPPLPAAPCPSLLPGLGAEPREILASRDYVLVFDNPEAVAQLKPNFAALMDIDRFGICVTAPADGRDGIDFVSRFFAPAMGVTEDPVTGSTHCSLVPYWAKRLGKSRLMARQLSRRGGILWCEDKGERVALSGACALFLEGRIFV